MSEGHFQFMKNWLHNILHGDITGTDPVGTHTSELVFVNNQSFR